MIDEADIERATAIVRGQPGRVGASLIQRRMLVGYTRAADILTELQKRGVVGPSDPSDRKREVFLIQATAS